MGDGVHLYPQYGDLRCWPLDLVFRYGYSQLVTHCEGGVEGVTALRGRRGPAKDKVVYIVPHVPRAFAAYDPLKSVGDCSKYLWCRPEAKGEHGIDVDDALPLDAQEWTVVRVDGDNTVRRLHIQLGNQRPAAKPGGDCRDLVDGDVAEGANGRGDGVIHALTFRRREVSDETPLPRGVTLRDHREFAQVGGGRYIRGGKWAEEPPEGDLFLDIRCDHLRVGVSRRTVTRSRTEGARTLEPDPETVHHAVEDVGGELRVGVTGEGRPPRRYMEGSGDACQGRVTTCLAERVAAVERQKVGGVHVPCAGVGEEGE